MAAPAAAATQTYVFFINQTDVDKYAAEEFQRPLYYHSYIDLILLALLLVVSLVSNAVLSTTLITNRYLQQISSYIPILGLTLVHFFDCAFNGIISLAYMSRIVWNMGYPLCVFHNYISHFILGLSPLFLFLAGVDRYTCLNYPEVYRVRFTCAKHRAVLAIFSVLSGLMALPYLLSLLSTRPFPARMSCAGGYTDSFVYVISWALFPVALPLLFTSIIAFLVGRTLCLDRREKSRVQSRAWLEEKGIPSASGFRQPLSQHEIRSVCVWLALFAVYLCCSLPYVAHEINHQLDASVAKDETEHSEVCVSPAADVFVAWFRYLATGLHSAIIFMVCEEVRQETGAMISTWNVKPSSVIEEATTTVDDLVDAGSKSSWIKLLNKNNKAKNEKTENSKLTVVLFPSQFGIQMRFWNSNEGKFGYCWCDHLDVCCAVKAQKRKLSDSGFYSVRSEGRSEVKEKYKRHHDDFDVISGPRKGEVGGPKVIKPKIIVTESNNYSNQMRSKSTGNLNKNTANAYKGTGKVNKSTGNMNKSTGNVSRSRPTGNVNRSTGNVNRSNGNVNKNIRNVNRSTGNVYKSNGSSRVPEPGRVKRNGQKSKSLERIPEARMTNRGSVPGQSNKNLSVPKINKKPRSRSLDRYPEQSKSYAKNYKKFN